MVGTAVHFTGKIKQYKMLLKDNIRRLGKINPITPFAVHLRKIYNHLSQQLKL